MKVLQINIFGNLSTGRIAVDIYRTLKESGHEGKVAFARNTIADDVPYIRIGNQLDVYVDGIMTRLTDRAGFFSAKPTKKLIQEIKAYEPDIIHLHNLHGYYIHVGELFEFLKEYNKHVVWTLHDCWSYTGHCCYYSMAKCDRWKTGCHNCPQKRAYPGSLLLDNSRGNYKIKKELFTSLDKLHLVTVSDWLQGEVKKSFLKELPCTTIYNGIDLNVFKPTKSNIRKQYQIGDRYIVLGVASTWDVRKRLKDFISLSAMLGDEYKVVVVGVNDKEKKQLPSNMIGISRTDSVQELAGIYTQADVFFNASVEETFGLPTVEALACETPVVVYDATAVPEVVDDSVGYVVREGDLRAVKEKIKEIVKKRAIDKKACRKKAAVYEKNAQYRNYIRLYESLYQKD